MEMPIPNVVIVSVTGVPLFPSRISLRIRSVSDGYGPIVSVGVTAQDAPDSVPVGVVVVVVVAGLVGEPAAQPNARAAPAAPNIATASRRPGFLCSLYVM
jgi:hypothetical protein